MTPDQIRLECLKLAMNPLLYQAKPPTYSQFVSPTDATPAKVLDAARQFAAFAIGGAKPAPEPVEPGSMAEAIDALRREVPGIVRDTISADFEP